MKEEGNKEATQSPPQEPLCEYFASAVAGFPIEKFLDSDPIDSLADYLIRDAVTFWGRINAELEREHALDRTNETYQGIITFIDALKDYLGFLMVNSRRPEVFPDDFQLADDGNKIADKANSFREDLKDLFHAASETVGAERTRVHQERTDAIHPGEASPPPALEEYREKFKAT